MTAALTATAAEVSGFGYAHGLPAVEYFYTDFKDYSGTRFPEEP